MKRFDDVKVGEIFTFNGKPFVRCAPVKDENGDYWNAMRLDIMGVNFHFYNEEWVNDTPYMGKE